MGIPKALHDRFVARLAELAGEGQAILDGMKKTRKTISTWANTDGTEEVEELDEGAARQWLAIAANTLHSIVPVNSPHRQLVEDLAALRQMVPHLFVARFQRFLAVKRDFEDGFLDESWLQIRAEVATDYLSQAEAIFSEGYHVPAAVLAGAVLEDALRKLCVAGSIPTEKPNGERKTINPMNDELVKKQVYGAAKSDEIRAWAKYRNDAGHGDGDKVRPDDVRRMLDGVRAFVGDHLR